MTITDLVAPEAILPALKVSSKKQALQELAARAAQIVGRTEQEVFETLLQRERLGSTGIGSGIAVPHGKLPDLHRLYGFFARLEKPIEFEALDGEPVDLDGLSCRWNPLQSGRGRMLTLIIHGADDAGAVFDAVMRMARQGGNAAPVRAETLSTSWPPKGWLLEAQASRHGGSLWRAGLRVLALTLLARLIFLVGRPVGGFDPQHYVAEIASNTDFCKHDDTVSFVIDCPLDCIAAIQDYLEREHMAGRLRYGMHVSQTALMTCLVTNASGGLHVHFVDGGDGGYTSAARTLKAQLAPARTG